MSLTGNDLIYAYVFGVLPDLDHIIKVPSYVKENGLKITHHYPWRTFLQEPVMLLFISLFSFFVKSWVPTVFFTLHLILDYLMSYEKKPFYPFSDYKHMGFLKNIGDIKKESGLIVVVVIGYYLL
ncbi:hypothetical protein A2Z67_01720 [Candidatus Woesebacteria bacterium RBG_13_36_22]|uniref:Metal-dependent hydrolase n=1 Tax=Candidatus Woesebacteria bacterium RBG_13_36_22 TaxID=1802478 RepID=A0A1F7X292_9BACT|nr:MAG: hypothetical protein A2Z67_01720 [Candidatus Woesebacteria bacterium RBG_13_36_22]